MSRLKNITFATAIAVSTLGFIVVHPAQADQHMDHSADKTIEHETTIKEQLSFINVDENADGKITETEFDNSIDADTSKETFTELDTNKDGSLDEGEFDVIVSINKTTTTHQ